MLCMYYSVTRASTQVDRTLGCRMWVASHAVVVLLFSMWQVEGAVCGCRMAVVFLLMQQPHLCHVARQQACFAAGVVGFSVAGSGLGIDVTPVPSRSCCCSLLFQC
jgi:hypothetical protein